MSTTPGLFFFNERLENIFVENIETNYLSRCSCQSHLATELINRTYSMSVERLFDYIFGDNDFLVAYRASRRIKGFSFFLYLLKI
jgi:hypothetical protein